MALRVELARVRVIEERRIGDGNTGKAGPEGRNDLTCRALTAVADCAWPDALSLTV
jgi:hypothetical protein